MMNVPVLKMIFTAVLLVGFFSTTAYGFSAQQLLDKCTGSLKDNPDKDVKIALERSLDAGSCAGFIGGAISGINLVGNMLRKQGAMKHNFICLPKGIHAQQLVKDYVERNQKNKKDLQSPASLAIYNTFVARYPCKNNQDDSPAP